MLVCHCHRVDDRTIRRAARSGARTCEEVAGACRAGSSCGGCRSAIEGLLVKERASGGVAALPMILAPELGV